MLGTNEVGKIIDIVGPTNAYNILAEILSTVLAIAIPVLLALWRRSAASSKLKTRLIDAMVRGINAGTDELSQSDTNVVKRAVNSEAAHAGLQVQEHLELTVEKVKNENGHNGNSKNGHGKNGKNGD